MILVVGARPNFMKIAPIIRAIESFNQTNLSREMLLNSLSHWDQTNHTNLSRLPRSESVRGEMRPALWSVETTPWGAYFTGTRETRKVNELNNVPEAFCYWSGHSAIMGLNKNDWQEVEEILLHFSGKEARARRNYRRFVEGGVEQGRRPDLQENRVSKGECKEDSDSRILGDRVFIERVLDDTDEVYQNVPEYPPALLGG